MTRSKLFERISNRMRAFREDKRGNVVFTFTLALVPIIGFIGAAIDYSRANSVKSAMQQAMDATALMLSKDAGSLTSTQMSDKATNYFLALFNHPEATGVTITPVYTTDGGSRVTVTGAATVQTTFLKVMGKEQLSVNTSSTVKWGNTRLRVALALDTTGSMASSNKLTALKTATNNLLTQLRNAASQNGDVYVSIIPFSKDVNVDPVNFNQSWVRFDDGTNTSWDALNGSCSKSGSNDRASCQGTGNCSLSSYTSQSTCTSHGTCSLSSYTSQSSCTAAGTCSKSGYTTQSTCVAQNVCSNPSWSSSGSCTSHGYTWGPAVWTPGTWTVATWTPATWTPNNDNTWNGCVTDRDQNYDTTNTATTTSVTGTLAPAEQYSLCPVPLMGLSYDWTALGNKVNALAANGNTNQAIGLQWAFQSLTNSPFSVPVKDTNYQYKEVIILLTDGLNTQDRWYLDQASIDARQTLTCANVKTAGITIYTIQVNTSGDPTSSLLQSCASNSPGTTDHFFLLTSSTQIVTTFNQIGTQLSNLRVAN